MKKKTAGSTPAIPTARQTITGTVTRDGRPVKSGWVGLWRSDDAAERDQRPGHAGPHGCGTCPSPLPSSIRDGAYTLDVPFPSETWYVVVEEPGHPLTQVGPIAVALNEKQTLDIACTEGGRIRGRVKDVPPGWEGHLWVVAFSKTAVREEARVAPDGTFSLPPLPPGEYGLKVGHDAYEDAEVYPGPLSRQSPQGVQGDGRPLEAGEGGDRRSGARDHGRGARIPGPMSHLSDTAKLTSVFRPAVRSEWLDAHQSSLRWIIRRHPSDGMA